MPNTEKMTELVKFTFFGWLSFKCWDYMVASGAKLVSWKEGWSNRAKVCFMLLVPGITSVYLNLTQMWQIHGITGGDKGRSYIKAMVIINLLSNGAVFGGV